MEHWSNACSSHSDYLLNLNGTGFNLIACPCEKGIRVATIKTTGTVSWVARGKQKVLYHGAIAHLSLSLLMLAVVLFIASNRTHIPISLWAVTEAGKKLIALPGVGGERRGGKGRGRRQRGRSVAESESGLGVLYVYVPACKQWNLCIFQSLLGQSNVSSLTLIRKVSQFRVPSMEVPLHVCVCVCVCACIAQCVSRSWMSRSEVWQICSQQVWHSEGCKISFCLVTSLLILVNFEPLGTISNLCNSILGATACTYQCLALIVQHMLAT